MPKVKDRIILNTNLWISFLLTKDFTKFDKLFIEGVIVLLFSQELLDEFVAVARRPKFKKYFTLADLEALLQLISSHADFMNVTSTVNDCRDPKDNFLLSLALDGKATHLITGDKDLLDLQKVNDTVILTITAYLSDK